MFNTSGARTRRGGSCLKDIYKTFLIYRTCTRRAPAKPVRACTLRNWCLVSHVTFEAPLHTSDLTVFTLHTSHCALHTAPFAVNTSHFTVHTSHFTLHTSHFTLHTSHFTLHTSHCTLLAPHFTLHPSSHLSSSHLIPAHLFSSHLFSYVSKAFMNHFPKKLESGAPPRKRAPRMLSAFLPALEEVVMDSEIGCHLRAGAWVKLIKVWASLRFDDLAHLRSEMVKIYDGKFAGLMKRTKTTGAGKRVKELPFFVSDEAWVAHPDWVVVGLQALGHALGGDFELVVPAGVSRPGEAFNAVMAYPEAVAWSGEVMQLLKGERFWTEHSERSTMPSGLAAPARLRRRRARRGERAWKGSRKREVVASW